MNIKGLLNPITITTGVKSTEAVQKKERAIKSDNAEERDANGQEFYSKNKTLLTSNIILIN